MSGHQVSEALRSVARSPLRPDDAAAQQCLAAPAEALTAAARYHRLLQAVHLQVRGQSGVDPALTAAAGQARTAQVVQLLRAAGDLRSVGSRLDALGVPWLSMKGLVLAETLYGVHPEVRASADLDVVVPPERAADAVEALVHDGAVFLSDVAALQQQGVAQVNLRLRQGTVLDLHWHLFSLPWARRAFPWPSSGLFEGLRTVETAAGPVPTLDVEDTLLHLCAHAALSGASQLGRLVDLALLVREPVEWDLFVRRARDRRLSLAAALMLDRVRAALAAPVPQQVTDALWPRHGWRDVARAADALRPPASAEQEHWTLEGLYRSTRQDVPSTAWQLGRVLRDRARTVAGLETPQERRVARGLADETGLTVLPRHGAVPPQHAVAQLRAGLPGLPL